MFIVVSGQEDLSFCCEVVPKVVEALGAAEQCGEECQVGEQDVAGARACRRHPKQITEKPWYLSWSKSMYWLAYFCWCPFGAPRRDWAMREQARKRGKRPTFWPFARKAGTEAPDEFEVARDTA
jgi:hypothetical protein